MSDYPPPLLFAVLAGDGPPDPGTGGLPPPLLLAEIAPDVVSEATPVSYHIYANDYAGGPVDYSTPVATVTSPAYTPGPVPPGSDVTFAVRAFDPLTSLEERNVTARFRLVTGPDGEDLTGLPPAPVALSARPSAGGSVVVTWAALVATAVNRATAYRVYLGTPSVDYTTPAATLPAGDGLRAYRYAVPGLTAGTEYRFAVRAVGPAGEESNVNSVAATPVASGPDPVQSGGVEVVTGGSSPAGFPPSPPS